MKSSKIRSFLQPKNIATTQEVLPNGKAIPSPNPYSFLQTKLAIGKPGDKYEQEADAMANYATGQISQQGSADIQRMEEEEEMLQASAKGPLQASPDLQQQLAGSTGKGQELPEHTKAEMEAVFGSDFSQVKVHTDTAAVQMNQQLGARAFTHGNDVYFNQGAYQPGTQQGNHLLAHELTHVIQQGAAQQVPGVQRTVEMRPPGRGEASAFDRAQELIDRINTQSSGATFSLGADGRTMAYQVTDAASLSNFDNQLIGFIDNAQLVPMRLVSDVGRISGHPVVGDNYYLGYVDVNDLMASDDLSFQSILVHFLAERFATSRYNERIGTPSVDASTPAGARSFNRAHDAGHDAQERHFQDIFNDPSIRFNYEAANRSNGNVQMVFKSHNEGYRIFMFLDRAMGFAGVTPRTTTGARIRIRQNGNWFSVEEFQATRAAAAP
jgi:hypothetical protein